MTSTYAWYTGNRWYTSYLHVVTTNILSIFPIVAPRLTFWQNKNCCQVSVAVCFMLASAAITNQLLLKLSKEMKIIGCKTGTVWRVVHNLPASTQ